MGTASQLAVFLDRQLRVKDFPDSSHNGLQVGNLGSIRGICCGVDASQEFFEKACESGANFLICHHGISWSDSLKRITGLNYKRVAFLIRHNIALYACHLPLDAHPRYGNNVLICKALGLGNLRRFGLYNGIELGFSGVLPRPISLARFKEKVCRTISGDLRVMEFGPRRVRKVAVVSGGAADEIAEAGEKGMDVFVSGEPKLSAYSLAQEYGIHAVFAGHYATERFGVQALGRLIESQYRIPASFVDCGIDY